MKYFNAAPCLCLTAFLIVGIGGCTPKPAKYKPVAAPTVTPIVITAENQKSLFPAVVGNSWVYQLEREAKAQNQATPTLSQKEITYKISKVEVQPDKSTLLALEVYQDDDIVDQQEWQIDDTGIYQLNMTKDKVAFSPKQPLVKFPVKPQEKIKWEGRGLTAFGKPGNSTVELLTSDIQTVDTGVGPISAQAFEAGGIFKTDEKRIEGATIATTWMSPGIGIVRYQQIVQVQGGSFKTTLRLKNYNLNK